MLYFKKSLVVKIHDYIIDSLGGERGVLGTGSALDIVVERPQTAIFGETPFEDIVAKTTSLSWSIIRFHPFIDGNKRTALAVLGTLLYANGIYFTIPPYMVRTLLRVATDSLSEEDFAESVRHLCTRSALKASYNDFRHDWLPTTFLKVSMSLSLSKTFARFKRGRFSMYIARILIDWFGAGDIPTLQLTFQEYRKLRDLGYPKEVPAPEVEAADLVIIDASGVHPVKTG